MRWVRDLPIRAKLSLILLGTSAVSLLAAAGVAGVVDIGRARDQIEAQAVIIADVVGQNCSAAVFFRNAKDVAEVLASLAADPTMRAARVYDAAGQPFAEWQAAGAAPATELPPTTTDRLVDGPDTLSVQRPIVGPEREVIGHMVLVSGLGEIAARSRTWWWMLAAMLAAGTAISYCVTGYAHRLVSTPVLTLLQAMERVQREHRYSERVVAHGRDEIGALVDSFNRMMSTVEQRDRELAAHRDHLGAAVEGRTAELLASRDRAEAAARAKAEFLANMSHEIRTPLNGVLGMLGLALDGSMTAEQREWLDTAQTSAAHLLGILNDILDLSKIDAGHLSLTPEPVSLADLAMDALRLQASRAGEQGIELICRISPDAPQSVLADGLRLRQIIGNLIGNAVKFTEQGEVEVAVDVTEDPTAPGIVLSVRDTGIGVAPEKLESLFGAFSQADSSITRRYGGTGLGLSICRKLTEMMGGRITVQSELGHGTLFSVHMPMPGVTAPLATPQSLTGRLVVLLVRNERLGDVMAVELARHGASVCLKLPEADQPPPAWAFVDSALGAEGFAIAQQLRKRGCHVVILVPFTKQGEAIQVCRELDCEWLAKPFTAADIVKKVAAPASATAAPSAPARATRTRQTDLPSLRILVAEDNAVNQRYARAILERDGHSVTVANNGREGLDLLVDNPFDLVLMDMQMPELDGLETTKRIRAAEVGTDRHLPIIATTANAMQGDEELCLDAGMDGYVSKPIRPTRLFEVIAQVLAAARR